MRWRGTTGYNIIVMHISAVIGGKARYHIRCRPCVDWVSAVCSVHARIWTLIYKLINLKITANTIFNLTSLSYVSCFSTFRKSNHKNTTKYHHGCCIKLKSILSILFVKLKTIFFVIHKSNYSNSIIISSHLNHDN